MACHLFYLLAWFATLNVLTAVYARPSEVAGLSKPSQDAFYHASADVLRRAKPGAVLKNRKPPAPIAAFRDYVVNIEEAHQILYRTTDSHGNATATVLTVLIPHNADYSKVLSYQVAEDAACGYCAPSYVFQLDSQTGPSDGTSTTQIELLLIEAALEQGWVVIVPDHEGPNSAFLGNRLAGQAVLDGIRAAIRSSPFTGISKTPVVAMWGYSGGSLATGWAAELQPSYAPELDIAGAAVGGTVPDIGSVVRTVNNGSFSGLVPSGLLGLSAEYLDFKEFVNRQVKPSFAERLQTALNQCAEANSAGFGNLDIIAMFRDGFFNAAKTVTVFRDNDLGHATPHIPLYWYKAVHDEVSVVADSDALVTKYCDAGARIEYVRDLWSDHASLAVLGAFRALAWLRDVMNGANPSAACSTSTVLTSLLDISTIEFLPKFLIDALLDLIGKPIGPIF